MQRVADWIVTVAGYGVGIFFGVGLCKLMHWL